MIRKKALGAKLRSVTDKRSNKYTKGDIGRAKVVKDFLPPPNQLVLTTKGRRDCEMISIQHAAAAKILRVIESFLTSDRKSYLTYENVAQQIGRDPKRNRRMVAQVCDLLDAAAASAGVPLLALHVIRQKNGKINKKAWATGEFAPKYRDAILKRSEAHQFTDNDLNLIKNALRGLHGFGNRAAWKYLMKGVSEEELCRRVAGMSKLESSDAIHDLGDDGLGSDNARKYLATSSIYARDPKVRAEVLRRANGHCEYCGKAGFIKISGEPYLESHHILFLANDGADRTSNVIALCPEHHREAHFGTRSKELEQEMIRKISSHSVKEF